MYKETAKELLEFIEKSPSCFHAVKTMKDMLDMEGFEEIKVSCASLMNASEIVIQKTKEGIAEDAVSVVVTDAVVYLPLAELVDFEQEIERLTKEEKRLEKELARVNGMLSNEKFISKAPEAKINEEKAKLEKYTQMMEQVKERLAGLKK